MDSIRFGRQYRALRLHQRLRQEDLVGPTGLSRSLIAKIDRGEIANVDLDSIDRAVRALGARLEVRISWRGENLDRLLDEGHARLVERTIGLLGRHGWTVEVEATFSEWGERGAIDILARHAPTGAVLVVEVKSVVPDSQAMLHALDRKARLAPKLASDRGWRADAVGRLLVIGEGPTARRRVAELGSTFEVAFPTRRAGVLPWLAAPSGSMAGLIFLSSATPGGIRKRSTARQRVRRPIRGTSARPRPITTPGVAYGAGGDVRD